MGGSGRGLLCCKLEEDTKWLGSCEWGVGIPFLFMCMLFLLQRRQSRKMRNCLSNDPCMDLQPYTSLSPPQYVEGAMPPPWLLCFPSIACHFLPHTLCPLHGNCISWGRFLKSTFLNGFCIFQFRLNAFIQWLSMLDILNSAVEAIICHTEIQLDKMTD